MARSRFRSFGFRPRRRDTSTSVLLVALGAVAGVALGMVIADRAGGIDGLLRRGRSRGPGQPDGTGWRGDASRSDSLDDMVDDDSELSPESIAHMHVSGALPDRSESSGEGERSVARQTVGQTARAKRAARRAQEAPPRADAADRTRARKADATPQPTRTAPDDASLEARVLEAFLNDPTLQERAIDICASGSGTIELTGWVSASWEIGHALTLARGVPDVRRVVDRLAVRGGEPARDHSSLRYAGPPTGGESAAPRAD